MSFMDFRFGFLVTSVKLFLVIVLCNAVIFCFTVLRMYGKKQVFFISFISKELQCDIQKHDPLHTAGIAVLSNRNRQRQVPAKSNGNASFPPVFREYSCAYLHQIHTNPVLGQWPMPPGIAKRHAATPARPAPVNRLFPSLHLLLHNKPTQMTFLPEMLPKGNQVQYCYHAFPYRCV